MELENIEFEMLKQKYVHNGARPPLVVYVILGDQLFVWARVMKGHQAPYVGNHGVSFENIT